MAEAGSKNESEHETNYPHSHQSSDEPVYEEWKNHDYLDVDAYNNRVLNDKENAWVVAFVSPTCPSCHTLGEKWDSIQATTRDHEQNVKFGYVNTRTEAGKQILKDFTGDVQMKYTPTVLVYGSDKTKPVEYYGSLSKQGELSDYVCDYCDTNGFGHKPAGKEHIPGSGRPEAQ